MNTKIPEVKEIRPINFLYHRTEVKVSDLVHQIPVAKELFKEAVKLDLHPTVRYTGTTLDLPVLLQSHSCWRYVCLSPTYLTTTMGPFISNALKNSDLFRSCTRVAGLTFQRVMISSWTVFSNTTISRLVSRVSFTSMPTSLILRLTLQKFKWA